MASHQFWCPAGARSAWTRSGPHRTSVVFEVRWRRPQDVIYSGFRVDGTGTQRCHLYGPHKPSTLGIAPSTLKPRYIYDIVRHFFGLRPVLVGYRCDGEAMKKGGSNPQMLCTRLLEAMCSSGSNWELSLVQSTHSVY